MNIIKKLTPLIIPHITHLLTNIIIYEKYPTILKNTRISPSLKVDKPPKNIDSYHPICNLSVIDKICQQYLKDHLMSYFELHNIIRKEHHGSLKYHSTSTALAEIYHHLMNNYHNDKITALI